MSKKQKEKKKKEKLESKDLKMYFPEKMCSPPPDSR